MTGVVPLFRSMAGAAIHYGRYRVATRGSTDESKAMEQARRLRDYLLDAGPIYIKLGQLMATRSDIFPAAWTATLRALQDNAPHMAPPRTVAAVERELRRPLAEVFAEFDPVPIASASIAQVHRARLTDGRQVAVKLVKDGVAEQIDTNLAALTTGVRIAERLHPALRDSDLGERFAELAHLFREQADMRREAGRQTRIRCNFDGHPYVRVPEVVDRLVTDRMLVMEFMDGTPGHHAHELDYPAPQLAARLQDTIYTMLYMHGIAHGDPHPGNVLFTGGGDLQLLDYGITIELTEDEKWGLSSFYYACTRHEWATAAERFTEHFVTGTDQVRAQWDGYLGELCQVLQLHFDSRSNRWSTVSYFQDVSDLLHRYGARYTTSFTKVELVFLSCEGFATQLDPDIDIWANARRFTDRYSPYMSAEVRSRFDDVFEQAIPGSLRLRDRADATLIAPTHIHRYFFPSSYPVFVSEACGGRIRDVDGSEYVDLSAGYGPHVLGYAHPAINAAICRAVEAGAVNGIGHEGEIAMAELLVAAFPSSDRALLCNSGTEATLLALRICRAARRRNRVAKFEGHYHGFSDQAMVSSWFRFKGSRDRPEPVAGALGTDRHAVDDTLVLQYGDRNGLNRLAEHADELAAVICEPMPTSVAAVDHEFLRSLRATCSTLGLPLIFDEVVTGFRVAYGGAQSLAGVESDLTVLGKIIGGGLPCGAVVGRADLMDLARSSEDPFLDYEQRTFAGGTLSGNSLTTAAGTAAVRLLRDNPGIYTQLWANTDWLADQMQRTAAEHEVPLRIHAAGSIFSLSFTHRPVGVYRDRVSGSNFKATIALAYYMRKHGVYLPELHSFLIGAAHTADDLSLTSKAFDLSLTEMITDGLFVV